MNVGGPAYAVAFDPTGEYLLVGSNKNITLYRHSTSKQIAEYSAHGWQVLDISVSPCGNCFLSAGADRTAVLWDVPTGRVTRRLQGHQARVNAVACMPDGKDFLLTGSYDRKTMIWDKRHHSRSPVQVLEDANDSIECIACQSNMILTGSADGFVRVYDVRKGRLFTDALGHDDMERPDDASIVMRIRVGVDGAYYVGSTVNGQIRLVDLQTGDILKEYRTTNGKSDMRHNGMVFDRNEERVLHGGVDGGVAGFDMVTGEKTIICKYPSPILSMDYCKKKRLAALGCQSGETKVLKID